MFLSFPESIGLTGRGVAKIGLTGRGVGIYKEVLDFTRFLNTHVLRITVGIATKKTISS